MGSPLDLSDTVSNVRLSVMADPLLPKLAGPTENAPSAEDFDRLAALIKPSWELEDAPFSMGNRSLTAQEWEQLRGDPPADGPSSSHALKNGSAKPYAPQAGIESYIEQPRTEHGGTENGAQNGASRASGAPAALEVVPESVPVPPVQPARTSTPPAFPLTTPSSQSRNKALSERPVHTAHPAGDPFRSEAVENPPVPRRPISLSEELALDEESRPGKSRKGLYFGLAAAAVVILAGAFFATRSSDSDPAPSPAETDTKGASVSNARVDIPPAPSSSGNAAKEPPSESSAPSRSNQPAREHAPPPRAATPPSQPPRAQPQPPHNNNAPPPLPPPPKPSSKANPSGGIVRDVPF